MILFRSTGVALLLVVAGFTVAHSQVLYTLESPNPESNGWFGYSVSDAGDVNGDGYADVVIGAYREDGGAYEAGRAYVFSGATGAVIYTLESSTPESEGCFGYSVSGAGDLNNDGFTDVGVGAYRESGGAPAAGVVHLFSGANGEPLHTLLSPNPTSYGYFGYSISDAGDVDADGSPDLVVGAYYESGGAGRAYVFSGATGAVLYTLESSNPESLGYFGRSVAGAGDVDGDGRPDVIVGATNEDGGATNAGRAYVFSGATGEVLHTLESPSPALLFGRSVSGAGDADADGHSDLVVGAYYEDGGALGAGKAHVFSGATGELLYTLPSPNPEYWGRFGVSVSDAGDLDNDGCVDVVVGAYREDGGEEDAGRAYVFSAATGGLLHALSSPNPEYWGRFGVSVSDAGDLNNDGCTDVLVGAYCEDGGTAGAGRAYVFNGIEVPVELASFTCRSVHEGVLLEWVTCSEKNNYGFHVYRSDGIPDGRQRITRQLIPGTGTTTVPQTYSYLDPVREPGRYLYWLEQLDIDGSTAWHGPVKAIVAPQSLILRGPFPNPATGEVRLTVMLPGGAAQQVDLRLYDAAGRLLAQPLSEAMEGGTSREVTWSPEADIAPGLYWWTLRVSNHVLRKPMVISR